MFCLVTDACGEASELLPRIPDRVQCGHRSYANSVHAHESHTGCRVPISTTWLVSSSVLFQRPLNLCAVSSLAPGP
eukprot:2514246-Amphidinium_carterae.2